MNLRQAAKMALEALVWEVGSCPEMYAAQTAEAITALRAALAEADEPDETGLYHNRIHEEMPNSRPAYAVRAEADEPVAWQFRSRTTWGANNAPWSQWKECTKSEAEGCCKNPSPNDWEYEARALYTHPPRREPLTEMKCMRAICQRAICQRASDGYCAPCHAGMYP